MNNFKSFAHNKQNKFVGVSVCLDENGTVLLVAA